MTGIGSNVKISGSRTIKCNFIEIKGHNETFQWKLYYVPGLDDTRFTSTRICFGMQRGGKMTNKMYIMELVFDK